MVPSLATMSPTTLVPFATSSAKPRSAASGPRPPERPCAITAPMKPTYPPGVNGMSERSRCVWALTTGGDTANPQSISWASG